MNFADPFSILVFHKFLKKLKKRHNFHHDVIKWWQKWHLSIFLSRLILYCQYSTCIKFHVKWPKHFWDTAYFFIAVLLAPPQPALKFSKKPSPGRVNLKHTYNDERATDSAKLDWAVVDLIAMFGRLRQFMDKENEQRGRRNKENKLFSKRHLFLVYFIYLKHTSNHFKYFR